MVSGLKRTKRRGTRKTRNVWKGLLLIIEINKKRDHTLDRDEWISGEEEEGRRRFGMGRGIDGHEDIS